MRAKFNTALIVLVILVAVSFKAFPQTREQNLEKVRASIVNVYTYYADKKIPSINCGILLSDEGWLVTDYRNYADAKKIVFKKDGKAVKYSYIAAIDPEKDIIIFKTADKSAPMLGISYQPMKKEQKISIIGSADGINTVSEDGEIELLRAQKNMAFQDFVQVKTTSAKSIMPLGSAVVNENGELLGITTTTRNSSLNTSHFIRIQDILNLSSSVSSVKMEDAMMQAYKYAHMGRNAVLAENYDEAIEFYKKALNFAPNRAENYNGLGYAFLHLRDQEQAIQNFKKAIELNAKLINAYNNLAASYYYQGDIDQAMDISKQALQSAPNDEQTLNNLGGYYLEKKKPEEALKYFMKVLDITQDNANTYNNIGNVYATMNNVDEAMKYYRRAIEAEPDNPKPYANIAEIYKNNGFFDEAVRLCNKAIKLDPHFSEKSYYSLGTIQKEQGNFDSAVKNFQVAIQLSNKMGEAYFELGKTYEEMGDKENMKVNLSRAFELSPDLFEGLKYNPNEDEK